MSRRIVRFPTAAVRQNCTYVRNVLVWYTLSIEGFNKWHVKHKELATLENIHVNLFATLLKARIPPKAYCSVHSTLYSVIRFKHTAVGAFMLSKH